MEYPRYARTPKEPRSTTDFSKEIDIGRSVKQLDDGRPISLDYWYDSDTALDLVTAYYSSKDIEDWSGSMHKAYLVRNRIMTLDDHVPSTFLFDDEAGNSMWSVNWVEKTQ